MAGPIRIAILANGSQARREAALTGASVSRLGTAGSKAGKLLAGAFAVGGLVKVAAAVGKVGSEYVDSLNKIQALTGATDAATAQAASRLEGQGKALAKYGQTAGDAAGGVVELTKSGLTLNKALDAVQSTLILAKAGELEVADASELVANTLNTFHLQAKRAGDIANYLANAANISSSDVTDLAESLKYVSPLAAKAGIPLGQTSAILAELSNSGIKASQAGTSLRGILLGLQAPSAAGGMWLDELGVSVYGVDGKMRPFKKVIDDLRVSLGKVSQEDQNFALKSIFGRNSITAAQALIQGGSKTLDTYTAGVRRKGAAEKLAASASKGLAGTLASVKANVITTAESLYRQYSPAIDDAVQAGLTWIGQQKDAASELLDHVGPAVTSVVDLLGGLVSATEDAASPLDGKLLPALESLFDLVKAGADALDSLPDGVKRVGVEAGIAALVFPILARNITAATGAIGNQIIYLRVLNLEMRTAAGRSALASSAMGKLAGAAKAAGGVAGLVLLTEATRQSNDGLSTLMTTAGAAAIGFSVGGPIGAAVGGLSGLLYSVSTKFDLTGQSAKDAYKKISETDPIKAATKANDGLKASLDQVTGAYTGATRAAILKKLQDNDAIEIGAKYGISSRTLINAALGQKNAYSQISPVIANYQGQIAEATSKIRDLASATDDQGRLKNIDPDGGLIASAQKQANALNEQKKAAETAIAQLRQLPGALKDDAREVRAAALATADYTGKLKGIPTGIKSKIEAEGIVPTTRGVAQVAAQFKKIDKKQIKTLISASGADTTAKQVQRVIDKINGVGKTKVKLPSFGPAVKTAVASGEAVASQGGARIATKLKTGTGKAKADLGNFRQSLGSQIGQSSNQAAGGGRQVGAALGNGMLIGFSPTQARLSAQAAAAVRAAVAAARNAGKINSPSKETTYIGQMLGDGLSVGMHSRKTSVKAAAVDLAGAALAGLSSLGATSTSGVAAGNVNDASSSIADLVEKTYTDGFSVAQKNVDNAFKAFEKSARKRLKGKAESKALDRIDKAQQKSTKTLDQASKKGQAAVTASIQDQLAGLRAQAGAYDVISGKLDDQRSAYQTLVDQAKEYAGSIKDAIVDSGSVVGLGRSATAIVSGLRKKVAAAQAYAKTIQALTDANLNETSLAQILADGVDVGGATAAAILKGGPSAINEINTLTQQLTDTGAALGTSTADTLYGAGVTAAAGLVSGLESQLSAVQAAATSIATALQIALNSQLNSVQASGAAVGGAVIKGAKKKLRSNSPAKSFIDIGDDVVKGLGIGLDEMYVQRRGASLAASLQKGYGTPALDAYRATNFGSGSTTGSGTTAAPSYAGPLIGNVTMQDGETADQLAERLWFKLRSRA